MLILSHLSLFSGWTISNFTGGTFFDSKQQQQQQQLKHNKTSRRWIMNERYFTSVMVWGLERREYQWVRGRAVPMRCKQWSQWQRLRQRPRTPSGPPINMDCQQCLDETIFVKTHSIPFRGLGTTEGWPKFCVEITTNRGQLPKEQPQTRQATLVFYIDVNDVFYITSNFVIRFIY